MKFVPAAALLLATAALPAAAHPCDADAQARAVPLLRLHFEEPQANVGVSDDVKELAPV